MEQEFSKYFTPAMVKTTNLIFERGEGPYLYTVDGKRYLDYVSGIAVNNLGHNHPKIVSAIKDQVDKLIHCAFAIGYYPSAINYAAKLSEYTPGDLNMFYFANTGAEAVEGALKLARFVTKKPAYLGFRGSFHGRTYGALSITSSTANFRAGYEPLLPSVYHVNYPYCYRCPYKQREDSCSLECFEEIRTLFKLTLHPSSVALAMFEPLQGEGGYIVPPQKYVKELKILCKEQDILLAFDEVQTGFGRTGHMFAAEHFGVTPDIMALGKAMANGLPLSAVVSRDELMNAWLPGAHGSTFSAPLVSCAAALAALEIYEEERVLENCVRVGTYFKEKLWELKERYSCIGDVRGLGLMLAIEIVNAKGDHDPETASAISKYCQEHGLLFFLCGSFRNCIRFITPLNISTDIVDDGLAILDEAFKAVHK